MKLQRLSGAIAAALLISFSAAKAAEQSSYVIPDTGPKTMATLIDNYFNPAFRSLAGCSWGSSAPANGPAAAPMVYQCWADTTSNPAVLKRFDGSSWVVFGKQNASTHVWTPSYQGTDLGTASTATSGTSGHVVGFLDGANTWSGVQSFNSGDLALNGSSSGTGALNAPAAASSYIWTLPAATDTLVGKATADTLTNKTFDTAGTGNSFSINGLAATANTGTGAVVRATSPTLVTPALGTPSSGVATNLTGTASGLTAGNVTTNANQTGDVSSVGNATTIGANKVTNAMRAQMAAYTIKGNNSGSTANETDIDITALTSKASPVSADIILIQDSAASNAFKRTTVGALASAGSVASIAGNTGAFTLSNGITNSTNDIRLDVGNLPGLSGNTAAAAGKIGELVTSGSVTTGSLSTGAATNLTSITLTAGDWDISAYVDFNTSGGTSTTDWTAAISATTASFTPLSGTLALHERVSTMADHSFFATFPAAQVLPSTSTTYYLNVQWTGSGTAPTATGILRARRMR